MKDSTLLITADQGAEPGSASERVQSFQQPEQRAAPAQQRLWQSALEGLPLAPGQANCHLPAPVLIDNHLTFKNRHIYL